MATPLRFDPKIPTHFIALNDMKEADAALLRRHGLEQALVERMAAADAGTESALLAELGLGGLPMDPAIPPAANTFLRHAAAVTCCPWCGKALRSDASFPVFEHFYDQVIFYRFACCQEFYLLFGVSPQAKIGLFFPGARLAVGLRDYRGTPHNYQYYNLKRFQELAVALMRFAQREASLVETYLANDTPRLGAVACCFNRNHGHQITDDIGGLQYLADNPPGREIACIKGESDYFHVGKLFPELSVFGVSPLTQGLLRDEDGQAGGVSPEALFRLTMKHNLTVMRLPYLGDFQESAARRILDLAAQYASPEVKADIARARTGWPLVWVTLRGHARGWVSEQDGLAALIAAVGEAYPEAVFVYDGAPREKENAQRLIRRLPGSLRQHCAVGVSLWETLAWAQAIDFFIAPYGNGLIFTSIANKPGVVHTHGEWLKGEEEACVSRREQAELALVVHGDIVSGQDVFTYSYTLDRDVLLRRVVALVERLKRP